MPLPEQDKAPQFSKDTLRENLNLLTTDAGTQKLIILLAHIIKDNREIKSKVDNIKFPEIPALDIQPILASLKDINARFDRIPPDNTELILNTISNHFQMVNAKLDKLSQPVVSTEPQRNFTQRFKYLFGGK